MYIYISLSIDTDIDTDMLACWGSGSVTVNTPIHRYADRFVCAETPLPLCLRRCETWHRLQKAML